MAVYIIEARSLRGQLSQSGAWLNGLGQSQAESTFTKRRV